MNNYDEVKRVFNRAAHIYDYNCLLQLTVARQLIEMIKPKIKRVNKMIDLGCGTGLSTQILQSEIKPGELYAVDIANQCLSIAASRLGLESIVESSFDCVPFEDEVFDVVFSSMSFQWSCDINKTIQEAMRLLKPKGVLAFALPTDQSFKDLHAIFKSLGYYHVLNHFVSSEKIYELLSGGKILTFCERKYVLHFDNFFTLLKSIKNVGANCKLGCSSERLRKSDFFKINEHLLAEFNGEAIPLEYAITFCLLVKD